MKLIRISANVAINPDSIDAIEAGKGAGNKMMVVHVRGKAFPTEMTPKDLLLAIESSGGNKWEGHFAG